MAIETAPTDLTPSAQVSAPPPRFGVNEVRLNARHWMLAFFLIALVTTLVPRAWQVVERFDTGSDYRIPYVLSKDYWLYSRRMRAVSNSGRIVLLGDSVVWGEYVLPDGTLSHFLNRQANRADRFVNGGVNGLFPLAEEGLVRHYGQGVHHEKVLVHCNLLWMSSPKADLSSEKEEQFNHSRLVPQFGIPSYKAGLNERFSAIIECRVPFLAWVQHLQNAYFGQKSILRWTLQEDGSEPPVYLNAAKNPLAQITLRVPSGPAGDPERGPQSPRHKPWSRTGEGSARFEWVDLAGSLQWRSFQRTLQLLRSRGNDVLVVVGPFNEHIMGEDNRARYRKLLHDVEVALGRSQTPHIIAETLPSELYADASHPLTEGYAILAKQIFQNDLFQRWYQRP